MSHPSLDIHKQVAAWLSIFAGCLNLFFLLIFMLFFGGMGMLIGDDHLEAIIAIVFGFLFLFLGFFAIVDIAAGIFYLRGSKAAEIWLIIGNILLLFGFPIGTAIGAYSLWAILRTPATPQSQQA